jgi:hypothetical protein
LFEALGKDPFAGSFEGHYFSWVGALWCRVLRMGAVDVETAPIGQHLVQLTIVIRIGPLPVPLDFESTRIKQGILIFIVPDGQWGRQAWIMTDDGDGIRNGVCGGRIA